MWKALIVAVPLIAVALVSRFDRAGGLTSVMTEITSELCSHEQPFLAENQAAMRHMMDGMNINPSGDVDRDFSAMMIPHHLGAIEMAQAELRHGQNEQLRRIAQEIIVEQQQEIIAMRLALGQELPPPGAAPDQAADLAASVANSGSRSTVGSATMVH